MTWKEKSVPISKMGMFLLRWGIAKSQVEDILIWNDLIDIKQRKPRKSRIEGVKSLFLGKKILRYQESDDVRWKSFFGENVFDFSHVSL